MIFRWTKKLGVWGWITVVVGASILTLASVVVGSIYWQRGRVETMFARIRAAGEPLTQGELQALLPAIPPERNATQLWLDGFAVNDQVDMTRFGKLPFVGSWQRHRLAPGTEWTELALAEEFLAGRVEALKLFHEAAELGGAARLVALQDRRNWRMNFDTAAPRRAAQALMVEAHVHAHKGQVGRTVTSLQAALAVGRACDGSPVRFTHQVKRAIDAVATDQLLLWLLPHVPFTDAQLAGFQSTLRAIDPRREHLHALLGERVRAIRTLRNPALLVRRPQGIIQRAAIDLSGAASLPHYLETMSEAIAATKLPWAEALEKAKQIEKRESPIPEYDRLGETLMPFIELGFRTAASRAARIRLADLALAVERYRLANGRLPKVIDDLTPDFIPSVPLDPYTDEPLHYRPTDDGFVIYSVDPDRKDDGEPREEYYISGRDYACRIRYPKDAADASSE